MSTVSRPILLATDDSNDVFAFRRYHKECGIYNPLEVVPDGHDVVRYLATNPLNFPLPALLIVSLKMRRMGGLQVLEHLIATNQNGFPSVLLINSQDHNVTLVAAAYRLQAESFLMRPIEKKEFCNFMSRFHTVTMDGYADVAVGVASSCC